MGLIREFEEAEWQCFAGAENFPCGGQPLYCEGKEEFGREFFLILHKYGVQFHPHSSEGETWTAEVEFPTQYSASLYAMGLMEFLRKDPVGHYEKYGFKRGC